jgi:hypothetical protein
MTPKFQLQMNRIRRSLNRRGSQNTVVGVSFLDSYEFLCDVSNYATLLNLIKSSLRKNILWLSGVSTKLTCFSMSDSTGVSLAIILIGCVDYIFLSVSKS